MERAVPARLEPSEGRKFAFTVGAAFLVLAGITWWREHSNLSISLGGLGSLLLVSGILIPRKLGPVYRSWMGLALVLSKFTTPVFMAATYFVVITPIGLLVRMTGNNPLERNRKKDSYWVSRTNGLGPRSDLKRQF